MSRRAIDTKTLLVSTTAVGLTDFGFTTVQINSARRAVVSAITGDVMLTWCENITPTATLGHPVAAGNWAEVMTRGLSDLKVIRYGSVDANVTVTLER